MPFEIQDWVEWSGNGEKRKGVVTAIDELTAPRTYIIKFEDGSKKGAREAQLEKTDPPVHQGQSATEVIGSLAGKMKGFLGSVGTAGTKTVFELREKIKKQSTGGSTATEEKPNETQQKQKSGVDGKVQELVSKGYAANTAQSALLLADGDVEVAEKYLQGEGFAAGDSSVEEEEEEVEQNHYQQQQPVEEEREETPPATVPTPIPTTTTPTQSSQDDAAFDFLSSTPTPSVSIQAPPTCLTSTSTAPGRMVLSVSCSDLIPGPVAASHVSIAVRVVGASRWQHQVDARSGGLIPFSHPVEWKETCYPYNARSPLLVTAVVSGTFPSETQFEVCARVATPMGPGPACPPITVTVPVEAVHVDVADLDDFFSASPVGSGVSKPTTAPIALKKVYYPPHSKGAIYDVD